jgi:hypothetical protein
MNFQDPIKLVLISHPGILEYGKKVYHFKNINELVNVLLRQDKDSKELAIDIVTAKIKRIERQDTVGSSNEFYELCTDYDGLFKKESIYDHVTIIPHVEIVNDNFKTRILHNPSLIIDSGTPSIECNRGSCIFLITWDVLSNPKVLELCREHNFCTHFNMYFYKY